MSSVPGRPAPPTPGPTPNPAGGAPPPTPPSPAPTPSAGTTPPAEDFDLRKDEPVIDWAQNPPARIFPVTVQTFRLVNNRPASVPNTHIRVFCMGVWHDVITDGSGFWRESIPVTKKGVHRLRVTLPGTGKDRFLFLFGVRFIRRPYYLPILPPNSGFWANLKRGLRGDDR